MSMVSGAPDGGSGAHPRRPHSRGLGARAGLSRGRARSRRPRRCAPRSSSRRAAAANVSSSVAALVRAGDVGVDAPARRVDLTRERRALGKAQPDVAGGRSDPDAWCRRRDAPSSPTRPRRRGRGEVAAELLQPRVAGGGVHDHALAAALEGDVAGGGVGLQDRQRLAGDAHVSRGGVGDELAHAAVDRDVAGGGVDADGCREQRARRAMRDVARRTCSPRAGTRAGTSSSRPSV